MRLRACGNYDMRIAMIGQKGIPATWGGVERHVEELGQRLVELGHDVVVFTRPNYTDVSVTEYKGMRLISLPTIGTKHLDAIMHSMLATLYCWRHMVDVVHYHAIGPAVLAPLARLRRRATVATIHGQDWKRQKWGPLASLALRGAEQVALRIPHATICVSESLSEQYEEDGLRTEYIPNGVSIDDGDDVSVLQEFGIEDGGYILFAGRLVPEKGLHYLIEAHRVTGTKKQLVVAGDSSNTDGYVGEVRSTSGPGVVYTGYQYGAKLAALFRHAALFVLPSDLEGLPIVLLEAASYGVPILASDIAPNVEILGEKCRYFRAGDVASLAQALEACLESLERLRSEAEVLKARAIRDYDWDVVAMAVQEVYQRIHKSRTSR